MLGGQRTIDLTLSSPKRPLPPPPLLSLPPHLQTFRISGTLAAIFPIPPDPRPTAFIHIHRPGWPEEPLCFTKGKESGKIIASGLTCILLKIIRNPLLKSHHLQDRKRNLKLEYRLLFCKKRRTRKNKFQKKMDKRLQLS